MWSSSVVIIRKWRIFTLGGGGGERAPLHPGSDFSPLSSAPSCSCSRDHPPEHQGRSDSSRSSSCITVQHCNSGAAGLRSNFSSSLSHPDSRCWIHGRSWGWRRVDSDWTDLGTWLCVCFVCFFLNRIWLKGSREEGEEEGERSHSRFVELWAVDWSGLCQGCRIR